MFASWGWTTGDPSGIKYKPVECPTKFKELISAQFDGNGVVTGVTPPPSLQPSSLPTQTPETGTHGCSWDGDETCAETTNFCRASQGHCEQDCGGVWVACSSDDPATNAPTTAPTTASTDAATTASTEAPTSVSTNTPTRRRPTQMHQQLPILMHHQVSALVHQQVLDGMG